MKNTRPSDIKFIIDRYFHYAINALLHGYKINGLTMLPMSLGFISYSEIPKRYRKNFTYSQKIYGYTFIPRLETNILEKYEYNYKPCKKILDAAAEMSETDNVYRLLKK